MNLKILSLLKFVFNLFTGFVTIGTLCDVGVWYYVKNVKIFDEEVELEHVNEEHGEH